MPANLYDLDLLKQARIQQQDYFNQKIQVKALSKISLIWDLYQIDQKDILILLQILVRLNQSKELIWEVESMEQN